VTIPKPATGATLTFLGAAGTVTGSRFLIRTAESTLLVDAGLFQGLKELRLRNWDPFPIEPSHIDAVVVTHAHIDHSGFLPRLVTGGFTGRVFCTEGTFDLARVVLPDSGHLHEEEARFANRKGFSKHHPALPLYTEADARAALEQFVIVPFDEPTAVTGDLTVTLRPAGHILGSSTATIGLRPSGRTVLFSGDLGRPQHPILRPPSAPDGADVIVMESTYGGREHDDAAATDRLADAITRTAERGGTVVIPAFAVDRTEVVLFRLRELMAAGTIPSLPVYADSPMALRALAVYRRAIERHADDIRPELFGAADPFETGQLHEIHEVEESKALAGMAYPAVIVSASGMATGGRVLHHLARLLPNRRNTVILVGFQAAGTRGRQLAEGRREIRMFGGEVPVRAEVVELQSFSVHADHSELIDWLGSATQRPAATYLVHGEANGTEALREGIVADLGWTVSVPTHLETVSLT
jgi:metallo-beta-lactamase family protein